MRTKDKFDEHGWLKDEYLWELRQQITLGSLFISDYENNLGISAKKVCDFFTGFWEGFCEELAQEDHVWDQAVAEVQNMAKEDPELAKKFREYPSMVQSYQNDAYLRISYEMYDNPETLKRWYYCFDGECPLPPKKVNVDIHWDFVRSIQVIAADEDEAEELVNEMMRNREIPRETFEDGDDWELNLDYQPDED